MLDLSTRRLQQLILNSDILSMLKVREEGLNYKYTKEKSKIQKLLSSQKISPRTGNTRELELEKWVDQELRDIDRSKRIYEENRKVTEENKKRTEEIMRETQITQEQLKKIIAEKVTTPREGQSFRSGFNSSRRLYELAQLNKQISIDQSNPDDTDNRVKLDKDLSADSFIDNQHSNIVFSEHEESKDKPTLKEKIENKIKGNKNHQKHNQKINISDEFDILNNQPSYEFIDVFKDVKFDQSKSRDGNSKSESDFESPHGVIETENSRIHSKTPNITEEKDEMSSKSFMKNGTNSKEPSKSLDIGESFPRNDGSNNEESNSNSVSLIRIKSEHNLKENKDQKSHQDKQSNQKERTYNSKNFFTKNFDDQEMEDAINKIKSNPDFDKPSPEISNESKLSNQQEDQNIDF